MNAFRCTVYACTLTVASCSARSRGHKNRLGLLLVESGCAGCEVGREHRKDQLPATWPDGSPVVRLELPVQRAPVTVRVDTTAAERAKRYREKHKHSDAYKAANAEKSRRRREAVA